MSGNEQEFNARGRSVVVQWGEQRSASTFQWQLLCLLLRITRGPAGASRACSGGLEPAADDFLASREAVPKFELVKTHSPGHWPTNANITLFCSTGRGSAPARCRRLCAEYGRGGATEGGGGACRFGYAQRYEAVAADALAEVRQYAGLSVFGGVGEADLDDVRAYLRLWVQLRRCCGTQQALSNRLRLHGCSLPTSGPGSKTGSDVQCESLNLTAIETSLAATNLVARKVVAPPRIGRCAEEEAALRGGREFNGASFTTCDKLLSNAKIVG